MHSLSLKCGYHSLETKFLHLGSDAEVHVTMDYSSASYGFHFECQNEQQEFYEFLQNSKKIYEQHAKIKPQISFDLCGYRVEFEDRENVASTINSFYPERMPDDSVHEILKWLISLERETNAERILASAQNGCYNFGEFDLSYLNPYFLMAMAEYIKSIKFSDIDFEDEASSDFYPRVLIDNYGFEINVSEASGLIPIDDTTEVII